MQPPEAMIYLFMSFILILQVAICIMICKMNKYYERFEEIVENSQNLTEKMMKHEHKISLYLYSLNRNLTKNKKEDYD